jgi:hypothetical protein
MLLRFGHVFGITILASDPKGDILKTFHRYEPNKNMVTKTIKDIRKRKIMRQNNKIEQNLNRADL